MSRRHRIVPSVVRAAELSGATVSCMFVVIGFVVVVMVVAVSSER